MKVFIAVTSAVVGIFVGLVGAFLQAALWNTPWLRIPWGVVVSVLVLIILIRGASWWAEARWAGWLVFAGWFLSTVAMAVESPSGDVALGEGARPLIYLIVAAIIGAFAATLPPRRIRVAS